MAPRNINTSEKMDQWVLIATAVLLLLYVLPGTMYYHVLLCITTVGITCVLLLQGTILNRTYGTHEKPLCFAIFTNTIWS